MPIDLTPERALIFRITHIANLPWLLTHGLHCANATVSDPNFVAIGNPDLIAKRPRRAVPIPPGGTLSDYVPFYFTPKSPMLLNIKTGWNGIAQRPNADIVVLVSSLSALTKAGVCSVFTDRHAFTATADFSDDPARLAEMLDWKILREHDFKGSDDYPLKGERYQAEALAHRHVPVAGLLGLACVSDAVKPRIMASVQAAGSALSVFVRPNWYF